MTTNQLISQFHRAALLCDVHIDILSYRKINRTIKLALLFAWRNKTNPITLYWTSVCTVIGLLLEYLGLSACDAVLLDVSPCLPFSRLTQSNLFSCTHHLLNISPELPFKLSTHTHRTTQKPQNARVTRNLGLQPDRVCCCNKGHPNLKRLTVTSLTWMAKNTCLIDYRMASRWTLEQSRSIAQQIQWIICSSLSNQILVTPWFGSFR
jgi:hypothetical protein